MQAEVCLEAVYSREVDDAIRHVGIPKSTTGRGGILLTAWIREHHVPREDYFSTLLGH